MSWMSGSLNFPSLRRKKKQWNNVCCIVLFKQIKCLYAKSIGLIDKCYKNESIFFLPTSQIYLVIFFSFYPDGPIRKMGNNSKFYFHVPFNNMSTHYTKQQIHIQWKIYSLNFEQIRDDIQLKRRAGLSTLDWE